MGPDKRAHKKDEYALTWENGKRIKQPIKMAVAPARQLVVCKTERYVAGNETLVLRIETALGSLPGGKKC